jgi:hypothetical protein
VFLVSSPTLVALLARAAAKAGAIAKAWAPTEEMERDGSLAMTRKLVDQLLGRVPRRTAPRCRRPASRQRPA